MIIANYLDFYDVFVNELAGSIWIFAFFALIFLWYVVIKTRMNTEVGILFTIVFLIGLFSKTKIMVFYVFPILGIGGLFYYAYQKLIRRG